MIGIAIVSALALHHMTVPQLEARIEADARNCIERNIESACSDRAPMRELWRRGYCSKDATGRIARCSPREVAEDRRFTEDR
jgi:hypothetical protein